MGIPAQPGRPGLTIKHCGEHTEPVVGTPRRNADHRRTSAAPCCAGSPMAVAHQAGRCSVSLTAFMSGGARLGPCAAALRTVEPNVHEEKCWWRWTSRSSGPGEPVGSASRWRPGRLGADHRCAVGRWAGGQRGHRERVGARAPAAGVNAVMCHRDDPVRRGNRHAGTGDLLDGQRSHPAPDPRCTAGAVAAGAAPWAGPAAGDRDGHPARDGDGRGHHPHRRRANRCWPKPPSCGRR